MVSVNLLAGLQAEDLQTLQGLAHLHDLRLAIQFLSVDPSVQRSEVSWGQAVHAPQPLTDRAGILQDGFAVGLHTVLTRRQTFRAYCPTGVDSRGVEERLKTASERIAKMTLGVVAARMSALEIQNLHNDASDVEQVTKRFFDDYTKVYFDLQEGRHVLRSLQPQ